MFAKGKLAKVALRTLAADGKCTLHDVWHLLRLVAVTCTAYGSHPLIGCFAVSGQHLGNPNRIIVADVPQMTRHREDEIVTASVFGRSTHLLFQCLDDERVGDAFVGLRVSGCCIFTTESAEFH